MNTIQDEFGNELCINCKSNVVFQGVKDEKEIYKCDCGLSDKEIDVV